MQPALMTQPCYCDLPLTTVHNGVDRSTQLPGEVAKEPEHGKTGENSGEEIYQRHEDCLTVKQNTSDDSKTKRSKAKEVLDEIT